MRAARPSSSGDGAGRGAVAMGAGSPHACAQQGVNVEGADRASPVIHHHEATDLVGLHQLRGLGRKGVGADGAGVARHHVGDRGRAHVDAGVEAAAQVAVGVQTEQAVVVGDLGAA